MKKALSLVSQIVEIWMESLVQIGPGLTNVKLIEVVSEMYLSSFFFDKRLGSAEAPQMDLSMK